MAERMEAEWQRMEQMFQYMQTLGDAMGQPLPPLLFPSPPSATTPVSMNVLVCMFLPDIGHTTKHKSISN
jgi:hypothetical protein